MITFGGRIRENGGVPDDAPLLDPVLLVDDLELLWFDPTDGSSYHHRVRDGFTVSAAFSARGAAVLGELLTTGGATLVPRPASRLFARAQERGLAGSNSHVAAAETPPSTEALVSAWEALRGLRRPRLPERVLGRVQRGLDVRQRLVDAGIVEFAGDEGRRLTPAGHAFALARRAELDAFVVRGIRPDAGFSPTTLRLGALLANSGTWRTAYRWVGIGAQHEARVDELWREAERGPDAAVWRVVDSGLRRATTDFVH